MTRWTKAEREGATKTVYNVLQFPERRVYAAVRSTFRSGMGARYRFYVVKGTCIIDVSYLFAKVADYRFDDDDCSVVVSGCGFNRPQAVVDTVMRVVFGLGIGLAHSVEMI